MNTPTKLGLTPKQQHMKTLIKTFTDENGHAPSYEELMTLSNLRSTSAVHRIIHHLVARGHLQLLPGQPRSLTLID